MKILSSADIHINLHKKKVPYEWQKNRFQMLFDKLLELEKTCDVHIISGDVFDKKPQPDEITLFLSYINRVSIPTYVIDGNHEATSKGETFLAHFAEENAINNSNVHIFTTNTNLEILGQPFQFFPYTAVSKKNLPKVIDKSILVTHIRGEVPPHITAEYDLEQLKPWKLILLGDLHFRHKHEPYPMYYPGSPLNTSFDRDARRKYGVDIIHFNSVDDYTVEFVDLALPMLLRKTITTTEEMVPDRYNHVIYEVKGSIDELAKVEKTDLLDKKIVQKDTGKSSLDLKDKSIFEELELYLDHINVTDKRAVLATYKDLGVQQ